LTTQWGDVFDRHAIKTVSDNDKIKRAYVPSQEQNELLEAAGLTPADGGPAPQFPIRVLGDPARTHVDASYYRSSGHPQRERRLGGKLISQWLKVGDEVLIGVRNGQLYVARIQDPSAHKAIIDEVLLASGLALEDDPAADIALDPEDEKILAGALAPEALEQLREKYQDAPPLVKARLGTYIERGNVGAAVKRARGYHCQLCQALGLPSLGFLKRSGEPYAEAHHVMPVSALLPGSLGPRNVISVCAGHHRQIHYGNVTVVELPAEFIFTIDNTEVRVSRN